MKCKYCGSEMDLNTKVCEECGRKNNRKAIKGKNICNHKNMDEDGFCPDCGYVDESQNEKKKKTINIIRLLFIFSVFMFPYSFFKSLAGESFLPVGPILFFAPFLIIILSVGRRNSLKRLKQKQENYKNHQIKSNENILDKSIPKSQRKKIYSLYIIGIIMIVISISFLIFFNSVNPILISLIGVIGIIIDVVIYKKYSNNTLNVITSIIALVVFTIFFILAINLPKKKNLVIYDTHLTNNYKNYYIEKIRY